MAGGKEGVRMSDEQRLLIIGIVLAVFFTLAVVVLYGWG